MTEPVADRTETSGMRFMQVDRAVFEMREVAAASQFEDKFVN